MQTAARRSPSRSAQSRWQASLCGFWDNRGWGFGVSIITKRDVLENTPGKYGWDGGWGTSWYVDPTEELIRVLMTQRVWDATGIPKVYGDLWNSADAAIDD